MVGPSFHRKKFRLVFPLIGRLLFPLIGCMARLLTLENAYKAGDAGQDVLARGWHGGSQGKQARAMEDRSGHVLSCLFSPCLVPPSRGYCQYRTGSPVGCLPFGCRVPRFF